MKTLINIDKYTYEVDEQFKINIYRNGLPWRTETGDNALLMLIMKCNEQQELLTQCYPYIKDQADWGHDYEGKLLESIKNSLYSKGGKEDE